MFRFQYLLSILFIVSFCKKSTAETVSVATPGVQESAQLCDEESSRNTLEGIAYVASAKVKSGQTDPTLTIYKILSGKELTLSGTMNRGNFYLHRYCVHNGFLTIQSADLKEPCTSRVFRIIVNGRKVYSKNDDIVTPPYVDVNDLPFTSKTHPLGFTYMVTTTGVGCDFGATYSVLLKNENKYDVSIICKDSPW
ncbi:hypothetical protein NX722_08215 [Endozoicomonas gorgoniicola]|uniref:Uncharacterized protein n=1 Tax=Endozoicomonas gorgoniicola TaxID=1234144 RepID=A0ABT3MTC1_9GAMM|nr:hypothetical protein [Endozoicomonas gorgoniicola]MCW7552631.1 hypothetical protein [Endozoicomonas gorgoniicola]